MDWKSEDGSAAAEDIKRAAQAEFGETQQAAEQKAQEWTNALGEHAHNIAHAIRSAGQAAESNEAWLSRSANALSGQIEELSATMKERGFDGLRRDLETLARERPALFMGAAVTAGVAAARVLRSRPRGNGPPSGRESFS